eukprot:TRINITY_DN3514_c0_g2_i3.p1 TRINITY_DN3514_c0_g2~~TRINITY_DN3514_c0_g2_i3.p1  ORF type:complete len:199 (+),score=48.68 TRINITY_DN3514_c0_g2_i3:94-690(+)
MESHDHQSHRNHSWTPKTPSKKSAKRATSPSQLKERLKDRRLKVGGLKSDLLKRLKEWRDREKAKESEDHYDAQDSEPLKKKNKASNHRECESQGSESEEESEASVEISDGGNSDEEERESLEPEDEESDSSSEASDSSSEASDSESDDADVQTPEPQLPEGFYTIDKIIGRRRHNNRVQYKILWTAGDGITVNGRQC